MYAGENRINTVFGNGLLLLGCQISPYIKDNLSPLWLQKQTLVIYIGPTHMNGNFFFCEYKYSYNETCIFDKLIFLRYRVEKIMSETIWVLDRNAWKGLMY